MSWLQIVGVNNNFSLFGHGSISVLLNVLVLLALIYLLSLPVLFLANLLRLLQQEKVFIELTPAGFIDIEPEAFEKLFVAIYGLSSLPKLSDRLLKRKTSLSFEAVVTEGDGLKFIICLPKDQLDGVRKLIKASLPDISVSLIEDYLPGASKGLVSEIKEFKFTNPFYLPLKTYSDSSLAYQAGLLELGEQEAVVLQMTITPLSSRLNAKVIKRLEAKSSKRRGWLAELLHLGVSLIKSVLRLNKAKAVDSELSKNKLASPLFKTSLRLMVVGDNKAQVKMRTRAIRAGLASLSSSEQQSLASKLIPGPLLASSFKHRLPSLINNHLIMSVAELTSIYHFPGRSDAGRENVQKSLSRDLPIGLTSRRLSMDVVIGENDYGNKTTPIGLTDDERSRHTYIIGGTGNGKTTMLEYMASQDIRNKKGLMVIDPHGDLAEALLKLIPRGRIEDVIYFNPSDISHPIGLNLLELPRTLNSSELALAKDRVVESAISIFRKTFDSNDDGNAYRIERLLRNAVHTALTIDKATLFTVSRLLSDKYYRWEAIQNLEDASLKRFWLEEFNKAGDYQRIKMSLGPLARLERFERNLHVKSMVSQARSGFDFDNLLNSNKIIICNLSKGLLGEDASNLLGSLLLSKLQLAALRRQSISKTKRTPFYVYVDEFQNYVNSSFVAMFSEARKYGLRLIMAQQSPSQLTDKAALDVIMDNVGSLVAFRAKSLASEKLILSQFEPYINKHEISNLPRYHFYVKVSSTEPKEPTSGRTILLKSPKIDVTNLVIKSSQQLYANAVSTRSRTYSN